ncbi:hypothetical protein D3C83_301480 [compost metagenome]
MPDRDEIGKDESRQNRGLESRERLGDEHDAMTFDPVRQHAGKRHEKKKREVADESHHA